MFFVATAPSRAPHVLLHKVVSLSQPLGVTFIYPWVWALVPWPELFALYPVLSRYGGAALSVAGSWNATLIR